MKESRIESTYFCQLLPSPTGFCLDPIDSNVRKAAPANNTLKHNLSDQSEADKY